MSIFKKRDWLDWTLIMLTLITSIITILTVIYVDGGAINKGISISWIDILFIAIIACLAYYGGTLIKKIVNRETNKAFEKNQVSLTERLKNLENQLGEIEKELQSKDGKNFQKANYEDIEQIKCTLKKEGIELASDEETQEYINKKGKFSK